MVRALRRADAALAARVRLELYSEERAHRSRAITPGGAEVCCWRQLNAVSNDAGGQLSPARLANRPAEARRPLSAARARARALARARAIPRRSPRRCHGACDQSAGGSG